jgi:ABC-type polysaccharide/polyol phosphate transport system ATPase subunit|tara:strand:- start:1822 stop:1965 length:144 start_codon:yes stop_codon:yes gene_type:complete
MSLMANKKEVPIPEIHQADFPTYHSIKLCLIGKAHSGKKTQAKMIVD